MLRAWKRLMSGCRVESQEPEWQGRAKKTNKFPEAIRIFVQCKIFPISTDSQETINPALYQPTGLAP